MSETGDNDLLTREGGAALCGISVQTFANWVQAGKMPHPEFRDGRGRLYWCRASVQTALVNRNRPVGLQLLHPAATTRTLDNPETAQARG